MGGGFIKGAVFGPIVLIGLALLFGGEVVLGGLTTVIAGVLLAAF